MGKLVRRLFLVVAISFVPAAPTLADELSDAYQLVLKDPNNAEANLRYARMAEEKGKPRLALAAYERILINDPNNEQAKLGRQRMLHLLEPKVTQLFTSIGVGWDSNPGSVSSGAKGEPVGIADAYLRDDRSLGTYAWRSEGLLATYFVNNASKFDYEYLGATTGPVFDASPTITIHPALGAGVSGYEDHYYYTEGIGSVTLEGTLDGVIQSVRFRGGYRDYDQQVCLCDNGFYGDVTGRFAFPGFIDNQGLLIASPWLRWSEIKGIMMISSTLDLAPGPYFEWGAELGYFQSLPHDIVVGADIIAYQRDFDVRVPNETDKHVDNYLAPGASLTLKDILAYQTDLRFEYRYRINMSNDPGWEYHDNVVMVSFESHI